jgi:hypothetical protein
MLKPAMERLFKKLKDKGHVPSLNCRPSDNTHFDKGKPSLNGRGSHNGRLLEFKISSEEGDLT